MSEQDTKRPAFQFYPADYLADANVMAMTIAEEGAYIRLLALTWNERGRLPFEPARLGRLVKMSPEEFAAAWPTLAPCFVTEEEDGVTYLRSPRLDKEREKQDAFRLSQANKANARWAKERGDSAGTPPAMPRHTRGTEEEPEGFELAYAAMPRREGGHDKHAARKAYRARLREKFTAEEMLAGAQRYAAFCRATSKEGTNFVRDAARFFGPGKGFREAWEPPGRTASGMAVDAFAVRWLDAAKEYGLHEKAHTREEVLARFERLAASGALGDDRAQIERELSAVKLSTLVANGLAGDKLVAEVAKRLATVPRRGVA